MTRAIVNLFGCILCHHHYFAVLVRQQRAKWVIIVLDRGACKFDCTPDAINIAFI
jgi:hypothetical protein